MMRIRPAEPWELDADWIQGAFTSEAEAERVYAAIEAEVVLPFAIELDGRVAALLTVEKVADEIRVVSAVGHDMSQWLDAWMQGLIDFARVEGCSRIRVRGRPGWVRALKPWGFRTHSVDLVTDIGEVN
jgi:hypothetical protein